MCPQRSQRKGRKTSLGRGLAAKVQTHGEGGCLGGGANPPKQMFRLRMFADAAYRDWLLAYEAIRLR